MLEKISCFHLLPVYPVSLLLLLPFTSSKQKRVGSCRILGLFRAKFSKERIHPIQYSFHGTASISHCNGFALVVKGGEGKKAFLGPFCQKNSTNNFQYSTLMKDYEGLRAFFGPLCKKIAKTTFNVSL